MLLLCAIFPSMPGGPSTSQHWPNWHAALPPNGERAEDACRYACREAVVNRALDRVRQRVAAELGEVSADAAGLTWVTEFPMFEWCAPDYDDFSSSAKRC